MLKNYLRKFILYRHFLEEELLTDIECNLFITIGQLTIGQFVFCPKLSSNLDLLRASVRSSTKTFSHNNFTKINLNSQLIKFQNY